MRAKLLEVRVGEEVIPIMAVDTTDDTGKDRGWLLNRAGYQVTSSIPKLFAVTLETPQSIMMFDWGALVRDYLNRWWPTKLRDGDVIDVDSLRGKFSEPRKSARYEL